MKGIKLIYKDLKLMWAHKHGRIALVFLLIVPLTSFRKKSPIL